MSLGLAERQGNLLDNLDRFCDDALAEGSIYSVLHRERDKLFPDEFFADLSAPRGALTYPLFSREGLEVISLGPVVYLASKEKGDNSMPTHPVVGPRRTGRRIGRPA
jgi:hypothetical protein